MICSDGLPGYVWDEYRESLPMSSYLLAFVVTDFQSISDGIFNVWTRADAIQSAKYALSIGPKILKFYEEFFDIQYPLPKVDMISLPDFTAGGKFRVVNRHITFLLFLTIHMKRCNETSLLSLFLPVPCFTHQNSYGKLG